MKRYLLIPCVLTSALYLAAPAWAGSIRGTVTAVGGSSLTIQTPGRQVGVVNALSTAADRVTRGDYPYVYGGGHAQAGIASVGIKGPGYNGKRIGYDCSGSVAAVLAAGGVWPGGAGVPNDAGIVSELRSRGLIAPGAGTGPVEVTLYDDPGVHIFMNIDGRFFGTSDGGGGGNRHGGAGWLNDGAPDAVSRTYKRYHLLPSLLRSSTNAGHSVTLQTDELGDGAPAVRAGDVVRVTYRQTRSGTLMATTVSYPGAVTITGVVSSLAPDGSSVVIQTPSGSTLTLATEGLSRLLDGVAVGDTVSVTYTKAAFGLTVHTISVTAAAGGNTPAPAGPADGGPAVANGRSR